MATRRDKEKVIDEVWDDDRIRSFLQREPAADAGVHRDHFRLLNAYQSMRVGDFRRFLAALREEDGDLDAPDARGRSAADVIAMSNSRVAAWRSSSRAAATASEA